MMIRVLVMFFSIEGWKCCHHAEKFWCYELIIVIFGEENDF